MASLLCPYLGSIGLKLAVWWGCGSIGQILTGLSGVQAPAEFYNAKDSWYKTWNPEENNGEGAAMAVDYIRVWASDVIKEE